MCMNHIYFQSTFLSVASVKTKSKNLRTQYSKFRKPLPSGSAKRPKSKRQIWLERNLHFLAPFVSCRASASNWPEEEEEGSDVGLDEEDEDVSDCVPPPPKKSAMKDSSDHNSQSESCFGKKKRKSSNAQELDLMKTMVKTLQEDGTDKKSECDADDLFGQYIAHELRSVTDVKKKALLKHKISGLFLQCLDVDVPVSVTNSRTVQAPLQPTSSHYRSVQVVPRNSGATRPAPSLCTPSQLYRYPTAANCTTYQQLEGNPKSAPPKYLPHPFFL